LTALGVLVSLVSFSALVGMVPSELLGFPVSADRDPPITSNP
jgi:hypothetical protein